MPPVIRIALLRTSILRRQTTAQKRIANNFINRLCREQTFPTIYFIHSLFYLFKDILGKKNETH